MGPAGSHTQTHHNSHPHPVNQQVTNLTNLSSHPSAAAATAAFPSFFPAPYTHFQHLAALHTSLTGHTINTTDLILNQTNGHTANLWPSTTNNIQSSNAASSGRLSPFDFHLNGQGESFLFFIFFCFSCFSFSIPTSAWQISTKS